MAGRPGPDQGASSFTLSLGLAIDFHLSGEVFYLFPGIWFQIEFVGLMLSILGILL